MPASIGLLFRLDEDVVGVKEGRGRYAEGHERILVDHERVGEEAADQDEVQEVMKPRHDVGDQE